MCGAVHMFWPSSCSRMSRRKTWDMLFLQPGGFPATVTDDRRFPETSRILLLVVCGARGRQPTPSILRNVYNYVGRRSQRTRTARHNTPSVLLHIERNRSFVVVRMAWRAIVVASFRLPQPTPLVTIFLYLSSCVHACMRACLCCVAKNQPNQRAVDLNGVLGGGLAARPHQVEHEQSR